jgi:hypothetical protein
MGRDRDLAAEVDFWKAFARRLNCLRISVESDNARCAVPERGIREKSRSLSGFEMPNL